jgi:hypothetical protein
MQGLYLPDQCLTAARIKPGGRFIQNQILRVQRQYPSNSGPAHLAATELEWRAVLERRVIQAGQLHGFPYTLLNRLFGQSLIAGTEGNIFRNGFLKQLRLSILKDHTDLLTGCMRRFFAGFVMASRSTPSTSTCPAVGCSSPFRCCTSVDLPDPVCPAMAVKLPSSIVRDTSCSASRSKGVPAI